MSTLSIYPISGYLSTTVRDACFGADPLTVMLVRDLLMATFKQERTISPKYFGADRGASEKAMVDAIDAGERNGVLEVRYEKNKKGYDVMAIRPTQAIIAKLEAAKTEAQARFSR